MDYRRAWMRATPQLKIVFYIWWWCRERVKEFERERSAAMARVARDAERLVAAAELPVASLVEVGHVFFSWRTAWRVFASPCLKVFFSKWSHAVQGVRGPQAVRTSRALNWWSNMSMGYLMCADVAEAMSQWTRMLGEESQTASTGQAPKVST